MPSAQSELASLCNEFLLEETVLLSCPGNSVLPGSVSTWSSDRKQCQVPHGLHWKLPRPPKSPRYWILCFGNSAMAQVSFNMAWLWENKRMSLHHPGFHGQKIREQEGLDFSVLTGGWQLPVFVCLLLWVNLSSPMSRYGSKSLFLVWLKVPYNSSHFWL